MGNRGHNRHGPKRGGCCAPFAGEVHPELGPHLMQCGLVRGLLPYHVASSSIQPFGHNRRGTKTADCACPFYGRGAGTPSNTTSPGPRLTSVQSGILIHPAVWPQQTWAENWVGVHEPFFWGSRAPSDTKPFGHNGHGPKIGGCPFSRTGAGSSSNTMSPRLRPTFVPSGILMHTAVWPQ